MTFNIQEELKKLPENPGVYIMRDENDAIIYVGKANVLKNRVRQYFQSSNKLSLKTQVLVSNIKRFEYIVTGSELEALILECNLIKKNKPKYNILLKDDKNYPYIKVTMNEEYPRIFLTRRFENDGARYFGPYSNTGAVKGTIELVKKLFPVKTCNKVLPRDIGKSRPCLNFYIYQCLGPCQGTVDKKEYRDFMKDVCDFLGGNHDKIIRRLEKLMKAASEAMEYERAASLRDKMNSLIHISERQMAVSDSKHDQDVVAVAVSGKTSCAQVFFIRAGKLIGREHFLIRSDENTEPSEILNSFIKQFYNKVELIPDEIILQHRIDDIEVIKSWLGEKKMRRVQITVPQKGEKLKLVKMVEQNAAISLSREVVNVETNLASSKQKLDEITESLGLANVPNRIEAYDISNTGKSEIVGSMVVFENAAANKKEYRHFKIKSIATQDDYQSMQEVVFRRFRHAREDISSGNEKGSFSKMPDLILVDGGLGHVNAIKNVLKKDNIEIPVFGMVKDEKHRTRGLVSEKGEINLANNMLLLRFVTAIQDEAHRFAIEYNKKLRDKRYKGSVLDEIAGIGPEKKKALMKHFGSLEKIKNAGTEELEAVKGMKKSTAKSVYEYFRN